MARDSNGRFVPIDHPEAEAGDDPGIILPAAAAAAAEATAAEPAAKRQKGPE